MAVRRLHPEQPAGFKFTPENESWAQQVIAKYPEGKQASAVIPLLWRAQEQHDGWLPEPAIRCVAEMLEMAYIRVYEVATFYTMFQLAPVGRVAHVQVCGTTPCMLRGSQDLIKVCRSKIAANAHEVSQDGAFSWEEVECLGSCANAPLVQIGKDTYEDLTPELLESVLDGFAKGDPPEPGSQIGRTASCPKDGPTTLKHVEDLMRAAQGAASAQVQSATQNEPGRPAGIDSARAAGKDDLKLISGVGEKLESLLNGLGIFHFDQIAAWTTENIAWVDSYLQFSGRIARDDWVGQAKVLASGGETEFSRRAAEGAGEH